jgi:hypothetical protein
LDLVLLGFAGAAQVPPGVGQDHIGRHADILTCRGRVTERGRLSTGGGARTCRDEA